MKAVDHAIRILVVILIIENIRCQDGFSNQDLIRLHQIANEGVDTITGYNTNGLQRDPNTQAVDRQFEDERSQETNAAPIDSDAGTSNQYAAMQYSLPPEEFLQQMRSEHQYYQQQQISTPAPGIGYTATPQPTYQYSTSAPYYENNQQPNQIPQIEPKMSQAQSYQPNQNPYQYNTINSYNMENNPNPQNNSPSPYPPYLSTPNNNNQYVGTPASSYVSSSSPVYLSSPQNLQQYVSSPLAPVQTGSPTDFNNNRVTTTIGSNSYDINEANKKMQIDHYDNSANGVRYPTNPQQQYQTEYSISTPAPSSPYPEPKFSHSNSISQYQRSPYESNQQDLRTDQSLESINNDINRIGNYPSANNLFMNYVQPDINVLNNMRNRIRDLQQDIGQPEYYSHGDYGWKMGDKKQQNNQDTYASGSYNRNQGIHLSDKPVSTMSFHMETSKPHSNYEQLSKSAADAVEAQEFAKAAARAQEKQQMYGSSYQQSFNNNNQHVSTASSYYANERQKQQKPYPETSNNNPFLYSNSPQSDLITASPYYYSHTRENNYDSKVKQPFDHAKALKNIVPIDVSNVVSNNDGQVKQNSQQDDRYVQNYNKEQIEQSLKQYYKPITDSYYKDKNTGYGYNIKSKPVEDISVLEESKQLSQNVPFYSKQHESPYNQGGYSDKRYVDSSSQPVNYISQSASNYQDSVQSPANIQPGLQRHQNTLPTDISSILKFSDIPYRLTQGIPPESLRLNNNNFDQSNIPTPLPTRINQNVESHQIDAASSLLNKLMLSKQQGMNYNRPEVDPQTGSYLSTIHGFRVANPFNVDLKLVADMLKGKPAIDESQMTGLRDQYNKPLPMKLDIAQLQQILLKNDNYGNIGALSDGLSGLGNSYYDFYGSGRFPYQGVKYSRSQEEEEHIPIADASNNHPIGAVMEQDEDINGREVSTGSDITLDGEDGIKSYDDDRPKNSFRLPQRPNEVRPRHPNSLSPGRQNRNKQHPKSEIVEPYPLLKPPPPKMSRSRNGRSKPYSRRRRVNRPKTIRYLKTEPLFEAGSDLDEEADTAVPTLLRPPPPVIEEKSDVIEDNRSSS